jgi:hypothetical protein
MLREQREKNEYREEEEGLVENPFLQDPEDINNSKIRDIQGEKNCIDISNQNSKNIDANNYKNRNISCISKDDSDFYFTVMSKNLISPSLKPLCEADSFKNDIQNLFFLNNSNEGSEDPLHKEKDLKLLNNLNSSLVISRAESFHILDSGKIFSKTNTKCEQVGVALPVSKNKKKKSSNFFKMCFCK